MKFKTTNNLFFNRKRLIQFIMRTFILLFCTSVFSFSTGSVFSQNVKVVIDKDKTVMIDEVFDILRKQTNFAFIYQEDAFKNLPKVHLKKGTIGANELLNKILSTKNFDFELRNNNTVIIREITTIDSQQHEIKGNVTDSNGAPMLGANILEKGTTNGAQTDFDGNFTLSLSNKAATLIISYVGFTTKEVAVNGQINFNISLAEAASALDEVVLVGYGTRSKRSVTSAISSIDMSNTEEIPASSISQTLSGKAAGLNVNFNSAQPGGDITFQIRGSATGRQPLIVIDGMPTSDFNAGSVGTFGNGSIDANLGTLNPSDIESIDILKDASATAIYGSKAAGGVILITTKQGKKYGEKDYSIDLNVSTGLQKFYEIPNMLNAVDYMTETNRVRKEQWLYESRDGVYSTVPKPGNWTSPGAFTPYYSETDINEFKNGTRKGTDFVNEVTRAGSIKDVNLAISGNSKSTRFYSSFSAYDQKGIIKNNDLSKFNGRININQNFGDKLSGGINLSFSQINSNNVQIGNGGLYENSGILLSALQFDPTLPVRNADGEFQVNTRQSNFPNPVSYLDISNETTVERFLNTAHLKYDILPELYVKTQVGFDRSQSRSYGYLPTSTIAGKSYNGRADRGENMNSNYQFQFLVNYNKTFNDKHNVSALLGTEYMKYKWEGTNITATNFPYDGVLWNNLALGANRPSVYSNGGSSETSSYFSQLSYDYDYKYFIAANFRLDGSANFSPDAQYGFFPGISIGWDISKEGFMTNTENWLDQLKLRAGYGETGNDNIGSAFSDWYAPGANTMWGGSVISGVRLAGLGNPNLKWEKQVDVNVGVDFSLLNYRVVGSVEYFNRVVSRILGERNLISSNPVNRIFYNLDAEKQTYGAEVTLKTKNIVSKDFTWNSLITYSYYRDRWLKRDPSTVLGINQSEKQFFGEIWAYQSDGLVQPGSTDPLNIIPGTVKINDVNGYLLDGNGDRVVDAKGRPQYSGTPDGKIDAADLVKVGVNTPYTVGFSNTFKYKNFDLSIDTYGVFNRWKVNETKTSLGGANVFGIVSIGTNLLEETKDRWNSDNQESSGVSALQNYAKYGTGDYFLEKAWFIRVRNISLGYNFPNSLTNNLKISKLRVYGNLLNPFLFTPYTGMDPETDSYVAAYPNQRTFSLGLQLQF
ncbi:SusC/RagA family TonB-linked outer membrane protein [Gelidibacter salicanalis]|uniref:TonB-dependent receptor n=1 Tax=Gelidibacter salicanalis TaxID=291193 RepID=A0A934KR17_9FLAO|nr:TonB-dependent receptor [Gelidibacter salicanalis]MBJ7879222.1 TonB-dependent receptor [Gelidibacter salicanalis]